MTAEDVYRQSGLIILLPLRDDSRLLDNEAHRDDLRVIVAHPTFLTGLNHAV